MKKRGGFTLMEMVIVIAVMAVISTVLVAYNRTNDRGVVFFSDTAKVVGVLQRAKSFALEKRGEACAFGVHFEKPGTMIVFSDLPLVPGERCVKNGADNFNKIYDSGEETEEVSLSGQVYFSSLPSGGDSHDVVFIPPYLETEGWGTIKIETSDGEEEGCIEVGEGGQIYSDNDCSGI